MDRRSFNLATLFAPLVALVRPEAGGIVASPTIEPPPTESGDPFPPPGFSICDSMSAHRGGGLARATHLSAAICRFTAVAADGDSAKLPNAVVGAEIVVIHHGRAKLAIFADRGCSVDDGEMVLQPPDSVCIYICYGKQAWYSDGCGVIR